MGVTAVSTFIIANQNVVSDYQTSEPEDRIINELQQHTKISYYVSILEPRVKLDLLR